ncbi:uncharacterized protein (DUF983 family) [Roseibium hamelinense]|uniref:Uncharacterized protein (DUF983 family) n=1 Tax=Roseibium hamelinense TaxID=150831 RepID=A0A562SF54_9HYPH|nr:DUF983 domain-containing protein [Roseibium hamelinense]MTI44219.1 DUF983 domain-containing protein [Roseibium hamelinense]TWI79997.1 uncharacterized protein (DUF983 family) [Roseibium hamelinense]
MNVEYKTGAPEAEDEPEKPKRPVMPAMLRGAAGKCPNCGQGSLFDGFLKTTHACEVCGEELHHHRADDAPPYFNMTIVGHIIIPALLIVEVMWRPALWIHMALWIPLTLLLTFVLMRPVKGALVALQWALYMHGFDPDAAEDLPEPDPAAGMR